MSIDDFYFYDPVDIGQSSVDHDPGDEDAVLICHCGQIQPLLLCHGRTPFQLDQVHRENSDEWLSLHELFAARVGSTAKAAFFQ